MNHRAPVEEQIGEKEVQASFFKRPASLLLVPLEFQGTLAMCNYRMSLSRRNSKNAKLKLAGGKRRFR